MKTYTLVKNSDKKPRYKLAIDELEASLGQRIAAFLDIKLATIKVKSDDY